MPRRRPVRAPGRISTRSPTRILPLTGMPVTTVPWPRALKTRWIGIRNTPSVERGGVSRRKRSRASRKGGHPSPVVEEIGKRGAFSRKVPATRARTSSRTRGRRSRSARSTFVTTTIPRRRPRSSMISRCSRVCGMTPSSAATTRRTASSPVAPATMFLMNRSWPGTSTIPTRVPSERERGAKPRSIVIPRSFSSGRRSGFTPVSFSTRVDFPWSMWPAVPRTIRWISAKGAPAGRSGRSGAGLGLLDEEEDPLAVAAGDDLLPADESDDVVRRDLDEAPLAGLRLDAGDRLAAPRPENPLVEGEEVRVAPGRRLRPALLPLPQPRLAGGEVDPGRLSEGGEDPLLLGEAVLRAALPGAELLDPVEEGDPLVLEAGDLLPQRRDLVLEGEELRRVLLHVRLDLDLGDPVAAVARVVLQLLHARESLEVALAETLDLLAQSGHLGLPAGDLAGEGVPLPPEAPQLEVEGLDLPQAPDGRMDHGPLLSRARPGERKKAVPWRDGPRRARRALEGNPLIGRGSRRRSRRACGRARGAGACGPPSPRSGAPARGSRGRCGRPPPGCR